MSNDNHYYNMGDDALFQINIATGTTPHVNPIFSDLDNASDANCELTKGEYVRKPNSSDYELARGTKKSAPITFNYEWATNDAIRLMLLRSWNTGKPVQFLWSDLPITDPNATYFKAWCEVMSFPLPKKIEEGIIVPVVAKPTDYCEGVGGGLIIPELIIPTAIV